MADFFLITFGNSKKSHFLENSWDLLCFSHKLDFYFRTQPISVQCCISYRNQSFDLHCKSNNWFQYEEDRWAERGENPQFENQNYLKFNITCLPCGGTNKSICNATKSINIKQAESSGIFQLFLVQKHFQYILRNIASSYHKSDF